MIFFQIPIEWNKGVNTAVTGPISNSTRVITGARNDLISTAVDYTTFSLTRQLSPGILLNPRWLYIGRLVHAVKRNGGSLDYAVTVATDATFTTDEVISGTVNLADLEPNGDFYLPLSFSLSPGTYQDFKIELTASGDMFWELGKLWLGTGSILERSPVWGRSIKAASLSDFIRDSPRVFEIEYQGLDQEQMLYLTSEVKPLADICQMVMVDDDQLLIQDLTYLPGAMKDFKITQINNVTWNVSFDFVESI